MAFISRRLILIPFVFCISASIFKFARAYDHYYPNLGAASVVANEYFPEADVNGGESNPQAGIIGSGSAGIFTKALGCLSDKYIYTGCNEARRLTQSGELNVPPEYADEYCKGPCWSETNRVLDCIGGLLKGFVFYNKASVRDVRETIESGCGYGPKRGNFDVIQHIQAGDGSKKNMKGLSHVVYVLGISTIGLLM